MKVREWYPARELAGLPGLPRSERGVQMRADREGWRCREVPSPGRKGRRREYHVSALPAEAVAGLVRREGGEARSEGGGARSEGGGERSESAPSTQARGNGGGSGAPSPQVPLPPGERGLKEEGSSYDPQALWAWAERRPERLRRRGRERAELLMKVMALAEAGTPMRKAFRAVGEAAGVSPANLKNWYYGVNGKPGAKDYHRSDWAAALIPGYVGRTATAEMSPEAWEFVKADYLRPSRPSVAEVYERLRRAAREYGWTIPSKKTVERRLMDLPHAVRVLAREGAEALKRLYPAQERDRSVFHALEAVNADGHRFDVMVRWPDGEERRPEMVAWQDLYSGKILAWRVDKTENADLVRLSFADLVREYGIPDHAYLDNGRGFAAKWVTGGAPHRFRGKVREEDPVGVLVALGVQVHWTTPYHGQAKPIERAFGDLARYVSKHPALEGAYTGNKPDAKPENYGSRAVELEEFVRVLGEEIAAHNARPGRRTAVCQGRSFDEVFAQSYARSPIRKATAEQVRACMLAAEVRTARRNGEFTLAAGACGELRNRYWCPELEDYAGERVVVRFDPQGLHEGAWVYTMDGRVIGEAKLLEAAGFNDTEAARAHERARRQRKKAVKAQLEAERRMTAQEVAEMLPAAEAAPAPEAKVIRPFRPEPARVPEAPQPTISPERAEELRARVVVDLAEARRDPDPATLEKHERYRFWKELDARVKAGERLEREDLQRFYERFPKSSTYQAFREAEEQFERALREREATG